MKLKSLSPLLISLSVALPAAAQELNYSFVDVAYVDIDADGEGATGFSIALSGAVHENVFLFASYGSLTSDDEYQVSVTETDEIDITLRSFGIGFNLPVNKTTDFVVMVAKEKQKFELGQFGGSVSGEAASAGLRSMVAPKVELNALIVHSRFEDESDTGYSFGARYYLTPKFSLGAAMATVDDVDQLNFSFRLHY
jgi:hypothetical protein